MSIKLYSNESTKALIRSLISKGREPHSIAICGDKGQGKKAMASYIAAALLCENGNGEPCGHCKSCRMISNGVHPDFITVKPNENGNYKVDDIRAVVSDAVTKPNEGRFKVYLIPDLDRSGNTLVQVQNILLKLIEEPPEHCVMILTAASKEVFLETVVSRVLCLRTEPCTIDNSRELLKSQGYTDEQIDNAVSFGKGNIGRCVEYLEDPIFAESIRIADECMTAVCENDEYGLAHALFAADGKKPLLRQVLLMLKEGFHDACIIRAGAKDGVDCVIPSAHRIAEKFLTNECMDMYKEVSEHIIKLDSNANLQLTVNSLTAKLFNDR